MHQSSALNVEPHSLQHGGSVLASRVRRNSQEAMKLLAAMARWLAFQRPGRNAAWPRPGGNDACGALVHAGSDAGIDRFIGGSHAHTVVFWTDKVLGGQPDERCSARRCH